MPGLRLAWGTGRRHAGSVDESQQWVEFGRWLAERREEKGLRRREAAKRAKVSEALWRDLETGRKEAIGAIKLLPNPSHDVLVRLAETLGVPVEDVLARIGRSTPRRPRRPATRHDAEVVDVGDATTLGVKLRRLTDRDRDLIEHLVDGMLERHHV